MLMLDGVSVAYEDTPVLHDIRLSIAKGERVVLLGPSGSGKTTLLKKLYTMLPQKASLIHQDYALVPQLSVFHNVLIGDLDRLGVVASLRNLVWPRPAEVERVRQILFTLGMAEKLFEIMGKLSGGQRQRTAVARAVFRGSELLLADEPVSSVDPRQADDVLAGLCRAGQTVVVSLHNYEPALERFDRVVGLRAGRILFDLPAGEVDEGLLSRLYG